MDRFQRHGVWMVLWLAMLLASSIPEIFCHDFLGIRLSKLPWPPLSVWYQLSGLLILTVLSLAVKPLRPARDYVLLMLAVVIGWGIISPPIFQNPDNIYYLRRQVGIGWAMLIGRLELLIPALLMTAVALGRYGRRDLFVGWGRFSAPVTWSILFPLPVRTWRTMLVLGCSLAVVLLGALLLHTIGLNWEAWEHGLPHLPAVLLTSVFNAAAEEYVSRMLPLAVLIPVLGARHAIALTAVKFGLDHWYGQPSGPLGVILMTYAGWVLAKSMVETDGFGWAFSLHAFADVMIFSLLVLASYK